MAASVHRLRIYAARPIRCYFTGHERACLNALAALLPAAEIINPAGRYRTSAGWLRAWPRLLSTLAGLVMFGEVDGVGAWAASGRSPMPSGSVSP